MKDAFSRNTSAWKAGVNFDGCIDRMIDDAKNTRNVIFLKLLGVNGPAFTDESIKHWSIDWAASNGKYDRGVTERDWLVFYIDGTTFSGHPLSTTMMNTWRSLCYCFYYLECAGYPEPWVHKDGYPSARAAGDDLVIQCTSKNQAAKVKRIIE